MKAFKSLFIVLFAFIILATCCVCVSADDGIDVDEAYTFATDFLTEYYYAANLFEDYDFTKYIQSDAFLDYVNGLVESEQYAAIAKGIDYINSYSTSFTLRDYEEYDSFIKLIIRTDAYIRFRGANVNSHMRTPSHLIVGKIDGEYVLMDWIVVGDSTFLATRGDLTTVSDPDFWNNASTEKNDVISNQHKYNVAEKQYWTDLKNSIATSANLNEVKEHKSDVSSNYAIETDNSTPYAVLFLDKSAMVSWAEANYDRGQPVSGNMSIVPKYIDFHDISETSWDCTNFASHALLAGGATVYSPTTIPSTIVTDDSYWFFVNENIRSRTWSGVNDLYKFLTKNRIKGPMGVEMEYSHVYNDAYAYSEGDLIQYYHKDWLRWSHTAIVSGFAPATDNSGGLEALVTYRSSEDICGKDVPQSYYEKAIDTRIIKLMGYYR